MTIQLAPDQERFIADALATGAYASAEDVVARALSLLEDENEWALSQREEINKRLHQGIAELSRGEGVDGELFLNDLRASLKARR